MPTRVSRDRRPEETSTLSVTALAQSFMKRDGRHLFCVQLWVEKRGHPYTDKGMPVLKDQRLTFLNCWRPGLRFFSIVSQVAEMPGHIIGITCTDPSYLQSDHTHSSSILMLTTVSGTSDAFTWLVGKLRLTEVKTLANVWRSLKHSLLALHQVVSVVARFTVGAVLRPIACGMAVNRVF